MKFRLRRLGLLAVVCAALAACVSDGIRRPDKQERARETSMIQTQLALEYMRIGDYRSAVGAAADAVSSDKHNENAWLVRAQIYQALGMDGMAEDSFQTALKLKPDGAEINNNYGWFLCSKRAKPSEAQAYFDRALADPTYPEPYVAYLNRGICAAKLGHYSRAERDLQQALDRAPDFTAARQELIKVKFLSGEIQTARQMWQDYASKYPVGAEDLRLAVRMAEAAGDGQAVKSFERRLREQFPRSEALEVIKQDDSQ